MRVQFARCLLLMAVPVIAAAAEPNEHYDQNPHARAVLECHAHYAQTYATVRPAFQATDIAIGAKAHCMEQRREFERHVRDGSSGGAGVVLLPPVADQYLSDFREFLYAYTVDQYLQASAGHR
ncbi:MAG: hypothetical protein WA956_15445 [Stenotrophomonas sp.]